MCLFKYEKFQKGQQHCTHFVGDWVDPVLSSDAAVVCAHCCRGRAWRVVPAGRGWSGTVRRGAGPARVEDLEEAATTRGKWRRGRGGDSERDAARRGRRRRPEGGGDEGDAATREGSGGEGLPKIWGKGRRPWTLEDEIPAAIADGFWRENRYCSGSGWFRPPLQMV